MGFVGRSVRMSKRIMAELARYASVNILEWDKYDVESMWFKLLVTKKMLLFSVSIYQNRFNVQLENLIEWAENGGIITSIITCPNCQCKFRKAYAKQIDDEYTK